MSNKVEDQTPLLNPQPSDFVYALDADAAPGLKDRKLYLATLLSFMQDGIAGAAIESGPPSSSDDETEGFRVGGLWLDSDTRMVYLATDVTEGAAVWVKAVGDDTVLSSHINDANNPHGVTAGQVGAIPAAEKGANSGVATLDSGGKVPIAQLPSYVSDVFEYADVASFPTPGEANKIYVALDTNLTYRWGGSAYTEISPSIALGETDSTAYRGDRGKAAYDHSKVTTGNPHEVTAAQVGAVPLDLTALAALGADVEDGDTYVIRRDGTTYKVSHAELVGGLISSLISENPGGIFRDSLGMTSVAISDCDTTPFENGFFRGFAPANGPGGGRGYMLQIVYSSTSMVQVYFRVNGARMSFRFRDEGSSTAWKEVTAV